MWCTVVALAHRLAAPSQSDGVPPSLGSTTPSGACTVDPRRRMLRGRTCRSPAAASQLLHRRALTPQRLMSTQRVVAVVSPPDNPALASMPTVDGVEFIVANDIVTFQANPRLSEASALMFVPPASPALLPELWPLLPNAKSAHCFFAGVDSLSGFMPSLTDAGVPLSNGRGAFSESLAEYVMAAALHFNKQIPRCQGNRKVMNVAFKTMIFLFKMMKFALKMTDFGAG